MNAKHSKGSIDVHAVYAFARTEQWIKDYAESISIHPNELVKRVAELLHAQNSPTGMVPLSEVRLSSGLTRQSVEPLAEHGGTHSEPQDGPVKRRMSQAGRDAIRRAQKARWAKLKRAKTKKKKSIPPKALRMMRRNAKKARAALAAKRALAHGFQYSKEAA